MNLDQGNFDLGKRIVDLDKRNVDVGKHRVE